MAGMHLQPYRCPELRSGPRGAELFKQRAKLAAKLHEVDFELTTTPEVYAMAMDVWTWLKKQRGWSLTSSAGLYSRCQWDEDREEEYGRGALFTITTEGPLYDMINYGLGPAADKVHTRFVEFLETKYNIYYELGFAWSLHFYPIQGPGRIWEE